MVRRPHRPSSLLALGAVTAAALAVTPAPALASGGAAPAAAVDAVSSGGGGAASTAPLRTVPLGRSATARPSRGARVLVVRAGRGTGRRVGSVRAGRRVTASCRATGRLVRGTQGRSRTWLKVKVGRRTGWIPAASARVTGGTTKVARCGSAGSRTPSGSANATVRVGSVGLAVRTSPTLSGGVRTRLRDGVRVVVSCEADGDAVGGSRRWAKLAGPTAGWAHGSFLRKDAGVALSACAAGDVPPAATTVPTPTTPATPSGAGNAGGSGSCVSSPTVTPTGRFDGASSFVAAAAPAAQRSQRETGVPASVTIAQAILESGWGNSHLGANNFFGIKATKSGSSWRWGANAVGCVLRRTAEQTASGSVYHVTAGFRMYRSMADSFVDHGSFLRDNSRYRPAFSHTNDAKRFATEIWRAGYATDTRYPGKLHDLMDRYSLQRYDR